MLLDNVLYLLAIGLNAYGIYLNTHYNKKRFSRYALLILFVGLLHLVATYICSIFYPGKLYLAIAFPSSTLYGMMFFVLYHVSWGNKRFSHSLYLHIIPFVLTLVGYVILMTNSGWRYHYFHDYFTSLYTYSSLLFVTYVLMIGWFHSGPDYNFAEFIKIGKHFLLPLSLLVLGLNILFIKYGNPGNPGIYNTFYLAFYITVSLPVIRLSHPLYKQNLSPHVRKAFIKRVGERRSTLSTAPRVVPEDSSPYFVPEDLAEMYRGEIKKFIASKAYLDIDLNKQAFCEYVNIPKTHISPFLKQEYDKSFNGFINELRLAYAANELSRAELVYTIDDLSFICGFRSRASFYRNFTALFGCPPHRYRAGKLAG